VFAGSKSESLDLRRLIRQLPPSDGGLASLSRWRPDISQRCNMHKTMQASGESCVSAGHGSPHPSMKLTPPRRIAIAGQPAVGDADRVLDLVFADAKPRRDIAYRDPLGRIGARRPLGGHLLHRLANLVDELTPDARISS
jgi:hypothetical protein